MGAPTRLSINRATSTTRSRSWTWAATWSPIRTTVAGLAALPLTFTGPPRQASVASVRDLNRRMAHSQRSTRTASMSTDPILANPPPRSVGTNRCTAPVGADTWADGGFAATAVGSKRANGGGRRVGGRSVLPGRRTRRHGGCDRGGAGAVALRRPYRRDRAVRAGPQSGRGGPAVGAGRLDCRPGARRHCRGRRRAGDTPVDGVE